LNLNKTEKTIIIALVIIAVLGLGIWLFAWPAFQGIEKAEKKVADLETERTNLYATLERENTIDQEIEDAKKDAEQFEKNFYPDLKTYETIEVTLAHLADSNLETLGITASNLSTYNLKLATFKQSDVLYNLKKYSQAARTKDGDEVLASGQFKDGGKVYTAVANGFTDVSIVDENGETVEIKDYTETMEAAHKAMVVQTAVSENRSQTVGVSTATFTVTGRYEDYLKFIDYIFDLERATYMSSVTIQLTTTVSQDAEATYVNEAGEVVSASQLKGDELVFCDDDTEVQAAITLMYLSVEQMEEMETLEVAGQDIVVNQ